MQSFDQSLLKLYQRGLVTFQQAEGHASSAADFKLQVSNQGLLSA